MNVEEMVAELSKAIEHEASAQTIFGPPLKLDNHTIVPVARVKVGMGGGGGAMKFLAKAIGAAGEAKEPGMGGGGGVGVQIESIPIGFIHERDGQVVFTAIGPATNGATQGVTPVTALKDRIASLFPSH